MRGWLEVIAGNAVLHYIADTCVSVSAVIVFLLLIRGLFMKKLPRIGMYVLWFAVLLRIVCPFTVRGIYSVLPERVEKMTASAGLGWTVEQAVLRSEKRESGTDQGMEFYGGFNNGFRLPYKLTFDSSQQKGELAAAAAREAAKDGEGMIGETDTAAVREAAKDGEGSIEKTDTAAVRGTAKAAEGMVEKTNTAAVADAEKTVKALGAKKETSAEQAKSVRGAGREEEENIDAPHRAAAWLLVLWGAGVFLCLCYEVLSISRTLWKLRDAKQVEEKTKVYTHPLVHSSFVAGIFVPKIYIPEYLESGAGLHTPVRSGTSCRGAERDYILRHERVHVRRRDYLLKPLAFSLFSLLWFNPLVWIAYYVMMRDMEISCDESVIRDLPPEERKKYSYLLLVLSSGSSALNQIPAFSAGEVRERIRHVSGYKKPTKFVTVLAAVAVILCSCGVVSSPEATPGATPEATPGWAEKTVSVPEKKTLYVEQDMQLQKDFKAIWDSKFYAYPNDEFITDPQGQFVCFRTLYTRSDKKEKEIRFIKCFGEDGEYQEPSWSKSYKKKFPNTKYWLERYKYGADGYLYLYVAEYSMDRFKYWNEYFLNPDRPFERVKNYLLKVDEQTGEMTEITLPEQEKRVVEGSGTAANSISGVRRLEFAVSADGSICLTEEGENEGVIYDASGQKISEITWENRRSDVYSGDGFWTYVSKNHSTGQMEVRVLDEDGDALYTLPTEVKDDGSEFLHMALGTSGDVILMVCGEGIYEAKLNEKKFCYIAGHETDQFYALWPDYYGMTVTSIYKGNQEDYYVGMRTTWESSDGEYAPGDEPESWDTEWMYHYTRVEEEASPEPEVDQGK